jgi:Holliday junction resolvase
MSVPPAITDAVRAGRRSRRRGSRGELQVVEILKAFGWTSARRNLARDERRSQARGDIAGGPEGVSIEVKLTERLKLREAFAQAQAQAAGLDIPVVAHRCNHQPWLATLPLEDLLILMRRAEL